MRVKYLNPVNFTIVGKYKPLPAAPPALQYAAVKCSAVGR